MNSLGEEILSHYETYLGEYIGADCYTNQDRQIQLLGYGVIKDSLLFATFGLSDYADSIGETMEAVLVVDDDYDSCAEVFMNAIFYAVSNKMNLARGTVISGADAIADQFSARHDKSAVYFTDVFLLPETFGSVEDKCRILVVFFISQKEADFIRQNGFEQFEDLLESKSVDVIELNRASVV